jgi:hypothetical protein
MKTLLYVLTIIFAVSCANKFADEAAKLTKETYDLHDEVMPITMQLEDFRSKVMSKAETMDTTAKQQALEISKLLNEAETEMNEWMPKLEGIDKMKDNQEKIDFLIERKTEGDKIKAKTLDAKKKAEDFLK